MNSESGRRILLVDDQPENLRLLEGVLGPYGYSVRATSSGEEALRLSQAEPPDLILLDIVMPGMSGYDVCRRMRESDATRFVPIVMLTANPDQDKIAAAFDKGVLTIKLPKSATAKAREKKIEIKRR